MLKNVSMKVTLSNLCGLKEQSKDTPIQEPRTDSHSLLPFFM